MTDETEDLEDIEVVPEDPETPTETVWQRYLRQVPVEESRRFQAIDAARLAECPWDKLIDLAAGIEAFLRDGRQVEPKRLKAVRND
jgi:hypothetical protein